MEAITSSIAGDAASVRGGRRRLQIIEAAMQQFAETGYRAASLREIAQRVGITHPGLLYHFGSKEELLFAVLRHRDEVTVGRLDPENFSNHVDLLRAVVEAIRASAGQPGLVELFVQLTAEAVDPAHPAHDYFEARYDAGVERLTGIFERLATRGLLRSEFSPLDAARAMVGVMDGLQIQWLYGGHAFDMAEAVEQFCTSVLVAPLAQLESETRTAAAS